ncbi:MAG: type II toxin-antitoxin system PemK/MazF family toxin [Candidatus Pacebacteria bacterium]|nr:type II toxin-antitoxin system PemK/MazF family toxin [Candidatus Paceibacterota bacterium]MBP9716212.1 type II toxin-antitoxin system PemK/MazF family toxin [Candidatus Paceibacterota bacterium]
MDKDFDKWNKKKIKINQNVTFNHPQEKEIWWCSIGMNVGSEVYGKGDDYTRPVLVINAEGSESFIGIPLTSKVKNRKYSCIIKTDDGILHTALVYQIRSFDKRRLTERKYILSDEEYSKIQEYFSKLYKL